jgi:hypothetical protein
VVLANGPPTFSSNGVSAMNLVIGDGRESVSENSSDRISVLGWPASPAEGLLRSWPRLSSVRLARS